MLNSEEVKKIEKPLFSILQKTNRILSGYDNIKIYPYNGLLAATDVRAREIYLCLSEMNAVCKLKNISELIALTKGLDYHELSHNLFTDCDYNAVREFCDKENILVKSFHEVLNNLEDSRIESLFSALYPRAADYFLFCAQKITLENLEEINLAVYVNLYGRKFIEPATINALRETLKKSCSIKAIETTEKLTDSFLIETDNLKRLEIAFKVYKILEHVDNSKNKQSQIKKEPFSAIESNCQPRNDKEEQNKKENAKQQKENNQQAAEQLKQQLKQQSQNKKEPAKQLSGSSSQSQLKSLRDKISAKLENNAEFKREIQETINQIASSGSARLKITPEMRAYSKNIQSLLKRITGAYTARKQPRKLSGSVNLKNVINRGSAADLRVFESNIKDKLDNARLNVSLILDASGSVTEEQFEDILNCSWLLSDSLEQLKNNCEIIEFADNCRILKRFADKNKGDFRRSMHGGTHLIPALQASHKNIRELSKSSKIKNNYVIVLTDGGFNDDIKMVKEVITSMQREEIKVIWLYICEQEESYVTEFKRMFDYYLNVTSFKQLYTKIKPLIEKIQREVKK